ncbi:uncharacterized protein [Amphiura filiformis]|uniref:uncharacterized protein n=1 Tax=Amphiura filiformis TaxID=82378 RepID=UPI003B2269C6
MVDGECGVIKEAVYNYLYNYSTSLSYTPHTNLTIFFLVVISLLDHFFDVYGMGERSVQLSCDNCSGRNKNRYSIIKSITLNFMLAEHTKLLPDGCFGLIKQRFRVTKVSCLDDMCDVVSASARIAQTNLPQLVGKEDGTPVVVQRAWDTHLEPYSSAVKEILAYHHFRFGADTPGKVFVRQFVDSPEVEVGSGSSGHERIIRQREEDPLPEAQHPRLMQLSTGRGRERGRGQRKVAGRGRGHGRGLDK